MFKCNLSTEDWIKVVYQCLILKFKIKFMRLLKTKIY